MIPESRWDKLYDFLWGDSEGMAVVAWIIIAFAALYLAASVVRALV